MPNQFPTRSSSTLGFERDEVEAALVREVGVAEHGRVGNQREDDDRHRGDQGEREELLEVGLAPPLVPARAVLLVLGEAIALTRRRRLLLAGDRRGDARGVASHPEALVADPVALHEVVGAAGAGRRQRADEDREVDLARERAEARDHLGRVAVGRAADGGEQGDPDEHEDRGDLEELEPLDGLVDDRRRGEDEADHEQQCDGDHDRVAAAERERRDGRRTGRPARPRGGEQREPDDDQAPRLPQPLEAGDRGLPGDERVALDLHVDEELHRHAHDRRPQEREPGRCSDVREEDVLTARDPDPHQDHARADQLAQWRGLGQLLLDDLVRLRRRRVRGCGPRSCCHRSLLLLYAAWLAPAISSSTWASIRSRSGRAPVNSSSDPAACNATMAAPSSVRQPRSRASLSSCVSIGM